MLAYFIALLRGTGQLSAILHDLEQTRERLDTFLNSQLQKRDQLFTQIRELRDQESDLQLDTRRARLVYNNLSNILESPSKAPREVTSDE